MENCSKDQLLNKIMQSKFYVNDLSLYLDTHPNDKKALAMHNEYVQKLNESIKNYENKYEPLSIETVMDNWEWTENQWPWERGFYTNVEL